jgi:uncharacterized protein YrzB (UPF0473 family)
MSTQDENGQGHVESFDETEDIDEVVIIIDEDDNERPCVILAVIEHDNGNEYALLTPADELDGDDDAEIELFILTIQTDENGDESFGFIEEEDEYQAVKQVFSTLMESD